METGSVMCTMSLQPFSLVASVTAKALQIISRRFYGWGWWDICNGNGKGNEREGRWQ